MGCGGLLKVGCLIRQGVDIDERGFIVVDEFQNTTRQGIYAVGDVCGKALLTPGRLLIHIRGMADKKVATLNRTCV